MTARRRIGPCTAAVAAAIVCAGCAGTGTLLPVDPPPVAAAWQTTLPHGGAATDLVQWWSRFNDPLLPRLIAAAQAVSPDVSAAAVRIERARATRVAAGAAGLPQVDAVASAYSARSAPRTPQAGFASLGVQSGWEIDLFGAVAAGRAAAQARFDGAQAGWHQARVALAAEVATSYTALRACEAQRTQAEADAASRDETSRLTELSTRAGFTGRADAALARAGAAQARATALEQRAQCATLVKSLVELTDADEPALRRALDAGTARLPEPEPIAAPELPAQLLVQRPDLVDAGRNVAAAASDQAQSRARQLPQVTLSGSLAGAGIRSAGIQTTGSVWTLGPLSVSFPLFDGGTRAADTAAARAAYDDAVVVYRAAVRRAVREVETSLVTLQSTAERSGDAQSAAADFETSLRATDARQRGGLASLFELEDARRNALTAQRALIELRRERAAAWISLYRALGGGWSGSVLAVTGSAPADPTTTFSSR